MGDVLISSSSTVDISMSHFLSVTPSINGSTNFNRAPHKCGYFLL